jgi:hypothetical protein
METAPAMVPFSILPAIAHVLDSVEISCPSSCFAQGAKQMHKFDLQARTFRNGIAAAFTTFAIIGGSTTAQAGSPFVTLSVQGASTQASKGVFPAAINGKSVITGTYTDDSGTDHGFIGTAAGPIASFDAGDPGTNTSATAINVNGDVAGYYTDSKNHGFVRHADGTFELFDIVKGSDTTPKAMNNRGVITGTAGFNSGFVRKPNGRVTQFTVAGAASTLPLAINAGGTIAGYYFDNSNLTHGFVRTADGTITSFDVPGGFDHVYADGIDQAGDIVGYTYNNAAYRGFLRKADGTFTVFNPSGCPQTFVTAINYSGTIIGNCFNSGDFIYHGFIRTADGTITMYDAPDAAAFGGGGTFPTAISSNGKSVGYDINSADAYEGYRLNGSNQ